MIKVKVQDLKLLFVLNREILGSAKIKQTVESPLGLILNAQKNYKIIESAIKDFMKEEYDIILAAANLDEKGKPKTRIDEKDVEVYDIPVERMEEFEKLQREHRESEVELKLNKFSEHTAEVIALYLNDEKDGSASGKTRLLIEYLTDIKTE